MSKGTVLSIAEHRITHCKNCGNTFSLNYCNNCGQKADTNRITWHELLHHLPHAIFHVDSGLFYTIKELATRPGHSIREYLEGKRKNHFSPFLMLVLITGLTSYLFVYFHFQTIMASIRLDELEEQNAAIAHKYFALRTLFFCLVCSIGDFLIFYEKKFTFPEMVVANTFMFCGVSVIQLLFIPLLIMGHNYNADSYLRYFIIFSALVYLILIRYQFYETKGEKVFIAKIILATMLYLVIIASIGQGVVRPLLGN